MLHYIQVMLKHYIGIHSANYNVLISNAIFEDGRPASYAKFENTIGFASTDDNGWFQIEIADFEPLVLSKNGKPICRIILPEVEWNKELHS